ncbi:hypothetical protein D7Y16_06140 [Stenotrophomonas maltophilia]|nr:hypothetical protein [Stenotrophomonas maltophilia]MBA0247450.1 hypothetical protein [Stenotrophomonas maltophilia]MBA0306417.1 hypothetical protein [Stenotrophomonas maltophilia]MBA0439029.1 hypothetical protein [Stenotrophomonas maltophilia]MBA0515864.1 hypothetical protein [Stenotrophomonas maltophilia]
MRGVSRMDAAAKPTRTYLRRPRNPTPPRQPTECPLLLLLLPRRVPGATRPTKNPACAGFSVCCVQRMLTGDGPGPRRPSPSAAGPAC